MTGVRRRVAAFVLPACLVVGATGGSAVHAAEPDLVTGTRSSAPVAAGTTEGQIASLDVGAGTWLAWATFSLVLPEPSSPDLPSAVCHLRARAGDGSVKDDHRLLGTTWDYGDVTGSQTVDLDGVVSATLGAGGTLTLGCRSSVADVTATRIRIAALAVPSVERRAWSATKTTVVDDDADAVLLTNARGRALPESGAAVTLGALTLPAGRWWLHASANILEETRNGAIITNGTRCTLGLGGGVSVSDTWIVFKGRKMHANDLAWPATGDAGDRTARLRCRTTTSSDASAVGDVRLAAVRTGRLTRISSAEGETVAAGRGDPAVIHVIGAGDATVVGEAFTPWTTVLSVPVPAGAWLAKATFGTTKGAGGGGWNGPRIECVLDGGADEDRDVIPDGYASPRVSLMAVVRTKLAGKAVLRCTLPDGFRGQVVRITDLDLTLVELDSITTRSLVP
jgi:hypothetical protein